MDSIWDNEKIARARRDAGLSAREAAVRLRITPQYVYLIESGDKRPSESVMREISSLYGLSIAYFLRSEPSLVENIN